MANQTPLILITNDDSIVAPGIRLLIDIMKTIGEVIIVAPDRPQSAMGHAITINNTLHLDKVNLDPEIDLEYSCSGTPVDCVKLAVNEILKRKPDLCVSGINHGSNASINVIYSGTMSAAVEACIEGIPAIGFSSLDYNWKADLTPFRDYIKSIALNVLKNGLPKNVALNVNFPIYNPQKPIKGIKICRQANAMWVEDFDKRTNPQGQEYYWLTGKFVDLDQGDDTDQWALKNHYISIVPTQFDLTAHNAITTLKQRNWQTIE